MNDMSELERRISRALDRIATHVATLQRPAPAAEPDADAAGNPDEDLPPAGELKAELDAEREVTAQLEERLRTVKEKLESRVAELDGDLTAAKNRIATLEDETEDLREAAGNVAGMRSEMDAMRVARADEQAEIAALLAELQPIVEESANA